jgi:hypothetical protein
MGLPLEPGEGETPNLEPVTVEHTTTEHGSPAPEPKPRRPDHGPRPHSRKDRLRSTASWWRCSTSASARAEIGKVKRSQGGQIYVAEREDAVLRKVTGQNQGPIKNEALKAIYREIMSAAIALEKPLLIAYLGPEASNTHAAAMKKFGASVDYHAMATISDIFTAVEKARPTTR